VICPLGFAISNSAMTPAKYIKVGGIRNQKSIPLISPPTIKKKILKIKKKKKSFISIAFIYLFTIYIYI